MAFAAVTILMDTLHQHFLQPTPRFPLRNKRMVRSLYRNLSCLQTSLEQDFKVGESDEAIKSLEARIRDGCVELRFQIEHHLRLFYLGKSMKLRLVSAKKLLPILSQTIKKGIGNQALCVLEMVIKHFALPVSCMPPHIKKRVISFFSHHQHSLYGVGLEGFFLELSKYEAESSGRSFLLGESEDEQESDDEWETKEEQKSEGELGSHDEQNTKPATQAICYYCCCEHVSFEDEFLCAVRSYGLSLFCKAESIIRQELRAPSHLNKCIKQQIQARQRIRKLFMQGIKLTSYINKQLLKLKNAYNQSKISQENITVSLIGLEAGENITVGDSSLQQSTIIKMVGCDDVFNMITDKLNQQSKKREIVSIVGMGGIGKTTLARRIYGDNSFISRFDCRAWATISQEYDPTKVFKALLCSLAPKGCEENNEASHDKLDEQVYKCLKHQRYLIVIDDIWSPDVWTDLQKCFPDDNNGSRMLLTTRLKNVVEYVGSGSNFFPMRFLDSYESWNLFHNNVLPQRITLSAEFERIGREIVKKCKELPLAISVVAGILSNSKQDLNEWELIAKNVHTLSLHHSSHQCENIIDLSYTFLPHHLKHCFLSIGCSFPEDSELSEDNIVDIWVSEGFLKVSRSKSLEDVAREALQDLVDRSLLIFREINGGLSKVYQIHDMLRELALREAQKENLLRFDSDFRFTLGFRRIQPINSSSPSSCSISQPWSIQSKNCSYNSLSHTCNTFLGITLSTGCRYTKQLLVHCKFLRTLVLEADDDEYDGFMCTEFMGLLHLRLLWSGCIFGLYSLPWFMLWNLHRLKVGAESIDEPLNISGLPQLKNLTILKAVALVPPRSVHHNLESIKYLDYRSCTKELFMRIPNLRTLAVVEGGTINLKCEEASSWFESLAYLKKLEVLEVDGELNHPKFSTIRSMNFLPNLKKLKLLNTKLNWEDMFVVGMLSKLEVLVISRNGVVGRKWEPKDGGFHGLKFLGIFDCDLECWEVTSGLFPVLECVLLGKMHYLETIPSGFADLITLKSIKIYECPMSIISSAKSIQEEQQDYGNNTFAVDILRNDDFDGYFWGYRKKRSFSLAHLRMCRTKLGVTSAGGSQMLNPQKLSRDWEKWLQMKMLSSLNSQLVG